jgi:hypothetical protein
MEPLASLPGMEFSETSNDGSSEYETRTPTSTKPNCEIERIGASLARLSSTSIEGLEGLTSEMLELQRVLKAEVERVQADIDSALAGVKIIVETIAPFRTKPVTSLSRPSRNGLVTWPKT